MAQNLPELTAVQASAAIAALNNYETLNYALVGDVLSNYRVTKLPTGYIFTIGDTSIFTGGGSAPPTPADINIGKSLIVDSVYGDDLTAQPYIFNLPYLTIAAAEFAAVAGDTIYVRSGIYTDQNLGKDNVNYHFYSGANLNSGAANNFTISNNNIVVTGEGIFTSTGINIFGNGAGNKFTFNCLALITAGNYNVYNVGLTEIIVNAIQNIEMLGTEQNFRLNAASKLSVTANEIIGAGGILQVDGAGAEVTLRANKIIYTPLNAGYVAFNNSNGNINIYADIYASDAGLYGTPVFWSRNQNNGTININVYGNVFSTCTDPLIWISNFAGEAIFYGNITKISDIVVSSAVVYFKGSVVSNTLAKPVINHNGGKTILSGLIKNIDNNPAANGIDIAAAGLILNSTAVLYITNVNSDSLYSAAPQNVNCYRAISNKAANINITTLVTPLLVDANVDPQ